MNRNTLKAIKHDLLDGRAPSSFAHAYGLKPSQILEALEPEPYWLEMAQKNQKDLDGAVATTMKRLRKHKFVPVLMNF